MKPSHLYLLLYILTLLCSPTTADHEPSGATSIVFATHGGSTYAFDIFALPIRDPPSPSKEIKLTDGNSINFNGHFPTSSSPNNNSPRNLSIVYVTERNGSSNIYFDAVAYNSPESSGLSPTRFQVPLLEGENGISFKDKPTLAGEYLIHVSTHQNTNKMRTSWAAVYSTELKTGSSRRLTPDGIADFSPAVSPSGTYTAVASYGEKGWDGELEVLSTDIYIFMTLDGSHRVKVVENGGWPSWVDESTIYFHRRSEEDNWISVYLAILPIHGRVSTESVIVERVTPPGLHAFTPATSPGNREFIAVATRRPDSSYRHIELFDLVKNEFIELTRLVTPKAHHFNPFLSADSGLVGYHRCRGPSRDLFLENLKSPEAKISLFRIDGSFPSFSPVGDRIAFVDFPGIYVVNSDGSNRRKVHPDMAFSTAWDPVRPGVVYASTGPVFATEGTKVDIVSINVDVDAPAGLNNFRKLTTNGLNNAFPSVSPDGKWVVFRSSMHGHKNLYIMDAVKGERGSLRRLTEGQWTDTMCSWSPNGEWIVFASDRANPGSPSFELFLIHPNRTGLRKLVPSGVGARANHPSFSPDGNRVVFTSDFAAISAEPISNPHHFQPYGEIYTVNLDGSDLKRFTHNSFEDGTPAWTREYFKPVDVKWPERGPSCSFEELHWLNEMPGNGGGKVSMVSGTPQCGALRLPEILELGEFAVV